ncbi:protein FAM149A-like [Pristis pectinata]|uniref:protein FAM149A-like n=1 Tax=Pristis pectinata TaxID=685728 RepID=UPI00223D3184|nr:protein FAM149A-like [Pristis pectinata]
MKVAVLDLGTIFAKIFTTSASPAVPPAGSSSSGSPASPRGPSVPVPSSKATPLTSSLFNVSGKASVLTGTAPGPECSAALKVRSASPLPSAGGTKPAGLSAGAANQAPARPTPSCSPVGSGAARSAQAHSGAASAVMGSTGRSPVHVAQNVGWNPPNKQYPFALPDIGEEWLTDTESVESSNEKKGLLKGTTDHIPEKASDSLPTNFTKHVQGAIHSYNSGESIVSESYIGQTTPTDLNNSWSGIQSYTTSLSTERSSVYSWRDDEFDKANTRTVHQLFWEIDEMLFEGKVSCRTESIQSECQEWTERSPQLRILGTQLLLPKDEGFQHFQSRGNSSMATRTLPSFCESTSDVKELSLSGVRLLPTHSPFHSSNSTISSLDSECSVFSFLEEEIYDVDGKIEEYFAYDSKECISEDESLEQKKVQVARRRNKRGIPPISPNACIKDAVSAEIFNDIWRDVIDVLEELIRKHWENNLSVTWDLYWPASCDQDEKQLSTGSSILSTTRNRMGRTAEHSVLSASRIIQASSRKTVTQRKLPSLSSELLKLKAANVYSDEILRGTKFTNASTTYKSSQYVEVIAKAHSGARHQVYQHFTLKRHTGLDQLASPPSQTTRHNQLPPINSESAEMHLPLPGSIQQLRGRFPHSRVSSAVGEGSGRRPLRERPIAFDTSSRPNTTHTFRSDTPFKRSFTPMDYASQARIGRASFTDRAGIGMTGIGVTGISLGISASSSNYHTDFVHHHHHLSNQPPIEGDEEEYRAICGPQVHLQSKTFNRFPTNSKKRSQMVS